MKRVTINGLENYFGPLPTAFKLEKSPYATENYYISPWWVLAFNKYHRDNLVQLLEMVFTHSLLLGGLNTGDWVSEILQMLSKPVLSGTNVVPKMYIDEDDSPNLTADSLREKIVMRLAEKIMAVDEIEFSAALEHARRYLNA